LYLELLLLLLLMLMLMLMYRALLPVPMPMPMPELEHVLNYYPMANPNNKTMVVLLVPTRPQ